MILSAEHCSVCSLAFPTGQKLLSHIVKAHKPPVRPTNSAKTIETEWLIAVNLRPHQLISDFELCLSRHIATLFSSQNLVNKPKQLRSAANKQMKVLVIDTTPSDQAKPQRTKLCIACPIEQCRSQSTSLNKLRRHFKRKHSLACSFEECFFKHFDSDKFLQHMNKHHLEADFASKRDRTLDVEAIEASLGFN